MWQNFPKLLRFMALFPSLIEREEEREREREIEIASHQGQTFSGMALGAFLWEPSSEGLAST